MGAIAVSKKEEQQIERLRKELRIPSKSEVIRVALHTLEQKTTKERLRQDIQKSVQRCAQADKIENQMLFLGVFTHDPLD
ncbi:MAG: ribbon-helix-helix protein, CopG family [Nitrospira sp. SB0677_bin_15]|nr:ribbon-helix-helix protein, CopG family [Nitrospira sp. SB0677_bin_15]